MSLTSILPINSKKSFPVTIPTTLDAVVANEFYYNGFPWPGCLSNGALITIYKRSLTHAGAGAMIFAKSFDGGATWDKKIVKVGFTDLTAISNLSLNVFNDRIIICWNEGSSSHIYHFAYSDNGGYSWVSGGTVTLSLTGYSSAVFSKPQKLPSGKLLQAYYAMPSDPVTNPYLAGFIQSTDNGVSWSQANTIASQMRKLPEEDGNTAVANGRGAFTEVCLVITHFGVSDATTKMVAYLRNEDYGGFTHYKSSDGGATWTRSTNGTFCVATPAFETPIANRPVHMINYSGTMYIFCGNRKPGDYGVEYITCTPNQLYANDIFNYSGVTRVYNGLADTLASDVDFGYTEPFIDANGQLAVQFYDANPAYTIAGEDWEDIIQKVILPL